MSSYKSFSLPPKQLLVVCGNVLLKSVLDAPRADAKRVFNDINAGKQLPLVKVRMDDDTDVMFEIALDQTEFRGPRLNFKEFRNSLAGLLHSIGEHAEAEAKVPVFTEKTNGAMLFGIPGFTQVEDELNVMMMSVNLRKPGCIVLSLMYVDPDQFKRAKATGEDSAQAG